MHVLSWYWLQQSFQEGRTVHTQGLFLKDQIKNLLAEART
jgi:hypothetical protein